MNRSCSHRPHLLQVVTRLTQLVVAAALAIAPALGMEQALAARLGTAGVTRWRDSGRLRFVTETVDDELDWGLMEDLGLYRAVDLPARLALPVLVFQGMGDDSVDWRLSVSLADGVREAAAALAGPERPPDPRRRVEVQLYSAGDHRLLDLRPRMWGTTLSFLAELGLAATP